MYKDLSFPVRWTFIKARPEPTVLIQSPLRSDTSSEKARRKTDIIITLP
jgi:hypothetical protein